MSEDKDNLPEPQKPGNRVFMTRAYLLPLEKNLYGLFRDIVEEDETGHREKRGKPIGPIKLLRPIRRGEDQDLVRVKTVHPKTGEALDLVEWEG